MSITVRAAAKINLRLGVGRVREDGYHPLSTVYQAIGLYDDVTVTEDDTWSVTVAPAGQVDCSGVPLDGDNIALRAGRLLVEHHGIGGAARIAIDKGIPVAGGLAGGSADAAATLVALDRLWDLETPDEVLLELAGRLGSDVPFALIGGTAYGTGRGELVEPVADAGEWWWVVVPNAAGLSTAAVYAEYDVLDLGGPLEPPAALLEALRAGDASALAAALDNDLEPAALSLRPDLAATRDGLSRSGARAVLLSGSGPTWLGLADDASQAREIAGVLVESGMPCWIAPGPVAGAHVVTHA